MAHGADEGGVADGAAPSMGEHGWWHGGTWLLAGGARADRGGTANGADGGDMADRGTAPREGTWLTGISLTEGTRLG